MGQLISQVAGAGCNSGNAGAAEGYLGSAGKLVVTIGMTCLVACLFNIQQLILALGAVQMMHAVGVVPENAEVIGGGRHGGQAAYNLVGVGYTAGVGVLGNAPHALDSGIAGYQGFYHIHVGAVFQQRHVDHVNAELFADGEVAVVARNRANPLDAVLVAAPGLSVAHAKAHDAGKGVIHCQQAGVAVNENVFGVSVQHDGHQAFCLGQAVQDAVVAAVGAVFAEAVSGG